MFRIFLILSSLLVFSYGLPQIQKKSTVESLTLHKNGKMQTRIINGNIAPENDYQYHVAIFVGNGIDYCSGSLISENMVLTTASCLYGFDKTPVIVYLGYKNLMNNTSDQQQHKSSKNIYIHPGYNPILLQNDIAIIELESKVALNDMVKPITVDRNTTDNDHTNQTGIVTGWGSTSLGGQNEIDLRYIKNSILSNDDCKKTNSDYDSIIQKTHICLSNEGDKGLCGFGDSGSPLVFDGSVLGIGAFGPATCVGMPSVFTRVSEFQSWIQEICTGCIFG